MKQEIFIGIAIAVVVLVVIKVWIVRLVKFKIDESTIVKYIQGAVDDSGVISGDKISAGTGIREARVASVCLKSNAIKGAGEEKEGWCLAS